MFLYKDNEFTPFYNKCRYKSHYGWEPSLQMVHEIEKDNKHPMTDMLQLCLTEVVFNYIQSNIFDLDIIYHFYDDLVSAIAKEAICVHNMKFETEERKIHVSALVACTYSVSTPISMSLDFHADERDIQMAKEFLLHSEVFYDTFMWEVFHTLLPAIIDNVLDNIAQCTLVLSTGEEFNTSGLGAVDYTLICNTVLAKISSSLC